MNRSTKSHRSSSRPRIRPKRPSRRWPWIALAVLAVLAIVIVGVVVAWPRVNPRRLDPVERVAEAYLQALIRNDSKTASSLGTVEEPPGISSVRTIKHDRSHRAAPARLIRTLGGVSYPD